MLFGGVNTIVWIEKLLLDPIDDYRKNAVNHLYMLRIFKRFLYIRETSNEISKIFRKRYINSYHRKNILANYECSRI
jgi:hypothetical protein